MSGPRVQPGAGSEGAHRCTHPRTRGSGDRRHGACCRLLSLIGKRELDIIDVALGAVTDEFLGYLASLDGPEELDAASEFLVVAATLLDMKIVGLLPQGEFVDAEDVALLEARDLLFARLLQYRAFKELSGWLGEKLELEALRHPRAVPLEKKYLTSIPELRR